MNNKVIKTNIIYINIYLVMLRMHTLSMNINMLWNITLIVDGCAILISQRIREFSQNIHTRLQFKQEDYQSKSLSTKIFDKVVLYLVIKIII